MLQPNTDTRIDAKTVGEVLLKSRGFFTEPYWFWICIVALLGFSLLFNLFYIIALMYLNRKCSGFQFSPDIKEFERESLFLVDKILKKTFLQLLVTPKLQLWTKVKTNITVEQKVKSFYLFDSQPSFYFCFSDSSEKLQVLLWNSIVFQIMGQRKEWFYLSNLFLLHSAM